MTSHNTLSPFIPIIPCSKPSAPVKMADRAGTVMCLLPKNIVLFLFYMSSSWHIMRLLGTEGCFLSDKPWIRHLKVFFGLKASLNPLSHVKDFACHWRIYCENKSAGRFFFTFNCTFQSDLQLGWSSNNRAVDKRVDYITVFLASLLGSTQTRCD